MHRKNKRTKRVNRKSKRTKKMNRGSSLNIISINSKSTDLPERIFQVIAVFFGVYSSIYCLADGLGLSYQRNKLNIVILISVLFYLLIFTYHKYLKVTLTLTLLLIAGVSFHYRDMLLQGFFHFENAIIRILNYNYNTGLYYYRARSEKAQMTTYLLILIIQIVVLVYSEAIYIGRVKQLTYLILLLFVGSPLLIGEYPPDFPLALAFLFIILLITMEFIPVQNLKSDKDKGVKFTYKELIARQRIKTHASMFTVAIAGVLLLLILVIFPIGTYKKTAEARSQIRWKVEAAIEDINIESKWNGLSEKFKDFFFADEERLFNIKKRDNAVYYGGISGGELGALGEVRFKNETALKLFIPTVTESMYLKGFVGGDYTKTAWEALTEEEEQRYHTLLQEYGDENLFAQNQVQAFLELFLNGSIVAGNDNFGTNINNSQILPLIKSKMSMDYYKVDHSYLYLPYITSSVGKNAAKVEQDSYYLPIKEDNAYSMEYYDISMNKYYGLLFLLSGIGAMDSSFMIKDNNEYDKYIAFVEAYHKFVYDVYAKEPKNVDALVQFTKQNFNLIPSPNETIMTKEARWVLKAYDTLRVANEITMYLASHTNYTLSPGALPDGKDYAEYFLFENRKGYCVHYATTAVLMLRSLSIPARYVEGYVVTKADVLGGIGGGESEAESYTLFGSEDTNVTTITQEMTTVEIRDTNAHAWIEVYLDGLGWMPVEVTAGYSLDGILQDMDQLIKDQIKEAPVPTRLPTNTPTPTMSPTDTPVPTEAENNVTEMPAPSVDRPDNNNSTTEEVEKRIGISLVSFMNKVKEWYGNLPIGIKVLLVFSFLLPILCFLIYLRYYIVSAKRENRITKGSEYSKILNLYYEIERILKWLSITKSEDMQYMEFARSATGYTQVPRDFEEVMELALKARFSGSELTIEEYQKVHKAYLYIRKSVYRNLYGSKRRWIKYILIL